MWLFRPFHRRLKKCGSKFDGPSQQNRLYLEPEQVKFQAANRSRAGSNCSVQPSARRANLPWDATQDSEAVVGSSFRLVDHAHMRGDDAPALRKPHPGLHLPADFSGHADAVEQGRGDGVVATVGADDRA
jgi:hypothetical protein